MHTKIVAVAIVVEIHAALFRAALVIAIIMDIVIGMKTVLALIVVRIIAAALAIVACVEIIRKM